MRKLPLRLLWGALIYLAFAYAPVAHKWWAARLAIQEIAGRNLTMDNRGEEIRRILEQLERDAGVVLYGSDVRYLRDGSEPARVLAEVEIPVHFPLTSFSTEHRFEMSARGPRLGVEP